MPRKPASGIDGVYEKPLGSGIYWIRYLDAEGAKKREKVGSKSAAAKLVTIRKSAVYEGRKLPQLRKAALTVSQLIEKYRKEIESNNKKSKANYVRHAEQCKAEFGAIPAASLTPGRIEAWKAERLETRSASTANGTIRYLKMLYNLALRDKVLDDNPLSKGRVKLAREPEGHETIFTTEQLEIMAGGLPRILWLHAVVALNTGLRQSEQFGALRTDIDLERGIQRIPPDEAKGDRAGKAQFVKLNSQAVAAYREIFENTPGPYVWTNQYGDGPVDGTSVTKRLQRHLKKLGIDDPRLNWHTFRHLAISLLFMAGVPINTIQKFARHKSITTTLKYAHNYPDFQEKAAQTLSDITANLVAVGHQVGQLRTCMRTKPRNGAASE